jgi:hypothetical protein
MGLAATASNFILDITFVFPSKKYSKSYFSSYNELFVSLFALALLPLKNSLKYVSLNARLNINNNESGEDISEINWLNNTKQQYRQ